MHSRNEHIEKRTIKGLKINSEGLHLVADISALDASQSHSQCIFRSILNTEIEKLKKNIVSSEEELAKSAAIKLGEIGGDEIVEFLISLLNLKDPAIRNRAALVLRDIKDNRALRPLLEAIFKKQNHNSNGTLVYALESLDCSKNLKDIFKILFYESYEAKISADNILSNQIFDFTKQDIIEIKEMWEDCIRHPDKCPGFDDEQTKLFMQDAVEGFTSYLDDESLISNA